MDLKLPRHWVMAVINFTKKALDELPLPPDGKRAFYRDSAIPGLGIRVTSKGVKTFIVYRKVEGKPQRTTLGRYPATKILHAKKKAEQINSQIAAGKNPNAEKRRARGEPTLGELYARYRDDYLVPHGKRTALAETHYQLHLKRWKGKKLSEIEPADVKALHARIGRTAGKPMANRVHQTLRAMLNWAIEEELLEGSNPAKGVRRFTERSRERFLQPDEMPRFLEALSRETNPTFRDFVLIALLTGARRANAQAMRWEEVHLERATWEIPVTKTGDRHTVPLSPEAVTILRHRKEHSTSDWVFPSHGESGHLVEPKRAWKVLLERAEIQDLRIHDLRRTLGSWQAADGASLSIIGKTLGHKNVSTTAIYARLNLDPVRQAVNSATRAMLTAGGFVDETATEEVEP